MPGLHRRGVFDCTSRIGGGDGLIRELDGCGRSASCHWPGSGNAVVGQKYNTTVGADVQDSILPPSHYESPTEAPRLVRSRPGWGGVQ